MAVLIGRAESHLLVVDVQDRLVSAMEPERPFVAVCAKLLQAANALRIPAMASEQYPKGLGRTVAELAELVPPALRYEKMEFSCYANAAIRQALTGVNQPQVVLAGIEAHVCVLQTVLELLAQGHEVHVCWDAVSGRGEAYRQGALDRMVQAGATLTNHESVAFEWARDKNHPNFKAVSALLKEGQPQG